MECRYSPEELSAYVDGELASAKSQAVSEHLRECAVCRAMADAMRGTSRAFGLIAPVEPRTSLQAGLARRLAMADDRPHFTCAQMQIWMSARLDGELGSEEAQSLREHLDRCPACATESAALQAVSQFVHALPEVSAPISLQRSILTGIAREQRGLIPRWLLDGIFRPRLAPGFATAAAAAALAVGFVLGRGYTPGVGVAKAPPTPVKVLVPAPVAARPKPPRVVADAGSHRAPLAVPPVRRAGPARPSSAWPEMVKQVDVAIRKAIAQRQPEGDPSEPSRPVETVASVPHNDNPPPPPPVAPSPNPPDNGTHTAVAPAPPVVAEAPKPVPVAELDETARRAARRDAEESRFAISPDEVGADLHNTGTIRPPKAVRSAVFKLKF